MESIDEIVLTEEFQSYRTTDGRTLERIQRLSRINVLVGANNSGKSRFMRTLSTLPETSAVINSVNVEAINSSLHDLILMVHDIMTREDLENAGLFKRSELAEMSSSLPKEVRIGIDTYKDYRNLFRRLSQVTNINSWSNINRSSSVIFAERFLQNVKNPLSQINDLIDSIPDFEKYQKIKRVYIPIIRGLRPLTADSSDVYKVRTVDDYYINTNTENRPDVFTGLDLYERLKQQLLGTNQERKSVQAYQSFISRELFGGREVTLTPSIDKKVVVVKIGREREQPIYNLGDGIQNAIILSYIPFTSEHPTFFFIEEPEIHLHPGLQRKILNLFMRLNRHTFFITTHSNHTLDITLDLEDMAVFNFRKSLSENSSEDDDDKVAEFVVERVDARDMSSLRLLGVRNSSVFLVNATIWVEGITDRFYFRHMLEAYMNFLEAEKRLPLRAEEDVHFAFVEYGGSNITHFSFLDYEDHPIEVEALCGRALVVIDQDGERKEERKSALAAKLGERLVILDCREVENSLPYTAIKTVVATMEGVDEANLPNFPYSFYKDRPIGKFIEEKILNNNVSRRGGYAAESGTIKTKLDFCEKVLPHISYTNLPKATQDVIERIYNHIVEHNPS